MSEHGHCPFLNRTDERCGEYQKIGSLDHVFDYCFGAHAACPLYLELLIERRTRNDMPATAGMPEPVKLRKAHVSGIVQVQVRRSFREQSAPLAYRNA